VKGDREEWHVQGMTPAREIARMERGDRDVEGREDGGGREEEMKRETFETGISVEAEFSFVKAIGSYCNKQ
jgi:hypothetical protein